MYIEYMCTCVYTNLRVTRSAAQRALLAMGYLLGVECETLRVCTMSLFMCTYLIPTHIYIYMYMNTFAQSPASAGVFGGLAAMQGMFAGGEERETKANCLDIAQLKQLHVA